MNKIERKAQLKIARQNAERAMETARIALESSECKHGAEYEASCDAYRVYLRALTAEAVGV